MYGSGRAISGFRASVFPASGVWGCRASGLGVALRA